MLGAATKTKRERKPDYAVGEAVSFHIYFGYGYTLSSGVIAEHIGPREYIVECDNGARFVARVDKDGALASGGAN